MYSKVNTWREEYYLNLYLLLHVYGNNTLYMYMYTMPNFLNYIILTLSVVLVTAEVFDTLSFGLTVTGFSTLSSL